MRGFTVEQLKGGSRRRKCQPQARLTVKLTVSFFDRGHSCLTDRARSLCFRLRSFCSFYFLFLVCFIFARARLHNNPAKVFPCGQTSTFSLLSLPFGVATVFFLFFPCTHPEQVEQASMVLCRRPFHHKDDDTREALPATLSSPKFS